MRFSSATRTCPFCCAALATKPGSTGATSVTCDRTEPAMVSIWATRVLTARLRNDGTTVR